MAVVDWCPSAGHHRPLRRAESEMRSAAAVAMKKNKAAASFSNKRAGAKNDAVLVLSMQASGCIAAEPLAAKLVEVVAGTVEYLDPVVARI